MPTFFIFIFFILFLPLLGEGTDDRIPTRCRKDGPVIQFPFRHKYLQPEYCGYPGFDVYCNEKNETVLLLPSSVNLVVKKVNYASQQIDLYDPKDCLPQKLLHLNLSASPFNFLSDDLSDYILFNCSASNKRALFNKIPCLGDSRYQFYAIDYGYRMDSLTLTSCSIHKISFPSYTLHENELHLKWSEPACSSCATRDRRSTLNNNTREHQIQCVEKPKINKGIHKGTSKLLIAGETLGSLLVVIVVVALILLCKSIITDKENQKKIEKFLEDYRALKPTRFSYSDIKRITNQFSDKLGEGGYGIVYKGKLSNEINVAVKVLNNPKENGEEFVNEVSTIGKIHHFNVVRLVGFCAEGFRRVLIYEFLPNHSLEKFIFQSDSKRSCFGWQKLQDIALGIAKGIEYLHQGCDQQILHFDIKPHNILLDHNFNPKICDFGLAKLCSKEQSCVTMTAARGTMGYIAPEVLSRTFGRVSYKSDVYSFGMLLLEMVGGRKNVDPKVNTSQIYFPQWIYNHLNLGDDFWSHIEEGDRGNIARKLTIVGLQCIQWHPMDRPSMKVVVQMLEEDGADLKMPPNPFPATNETNFVAGIPERHYQAELPLILETE